MKILDLFNLRPTDGDVGIEIELEGSNLPDGCNIWRRDDDGSLKPEDESAEYVLYKPVKMGEVKKVLGLLEDALEDSIVDTTYRAGTHVHINVQDMTMVQVMNMVVLFLLLEDFYINFCEESRRGNHFCLRSKDAGYLIHALANMCKEDDVYYLSDDIRYSAINLTSLRKYGSIEFRSLESTMDFDKVEHWCRMLHNLKQAALKYESPKQIMYAASYGGVEGICQEVLQEDYNNLIAKPDWKKVVRAGLLRAQDIAFSREWKRVNLNIFNKRKGVFNA